jgi:MFS superfamily sulfate permease-like transporter
MNTLIYYSFNIFLLSLIVLATGMFKPKWIMPWIDKPSRFPVIVIAVVLFMIAAMMFGEGNLQLKQEKAQTSKSQSILKDNAEVPDLH